MPDKTLTLDPANPLPFKAIDNGDGTFSLAIHLSGAAAAAAHAASHAAGGADVVTLTEAQITALVTDLAAKALLGGRTTFSNAPYIALATDKYIAQIGTMSAARAVTLPAAASVPAGYMLFVEDESNTVTATFTITLTPFAGDSISGVTKLGEGLRPIRCISDGVTKWTCDKVFLPLVQDFVANGTSVIPPNCTTVQVIAVGPGGGGGSGRRGAATTVRGGGGGGGSGGLTVVTLNVADLGGAGTTLTIAVPAGGTGALAQTVDSTDGIGATIPASTTVTVAGVIRVQAAAGRGGAAGTLTGGAGGIIQNGYTFIGQAGGAGGTGVAGVAGVIGNAGPASGAGGGGISSGDAAFAGGPATTGSTAQGSTNTGGSAGVLGGATPGGNAAVPAAGTYGGGGGGGGGSSITGPGGAGGNGTRGGGGGGGGASLNGSNSGAGGNGGDGWLRLIYL